MLRKGEVTIVLNNSAHYLFTAIFVSLGSCTNSGCLCLVLWRCKALPTNVELPEAINVDTEDVNFGQRLYGDVVEQ